MPDAGLHMSSDHEHRDVDVPRLLLFGGALCFMVAFSLVAMWLLFNFYALEQSAGPPPSPVAQASEIPPQPRLQVAEHSDLVQQHQRNADVLDSYGWVDRKAGVVRIPIARAMDLLAARGLPSAEASK